MCKIQYKKPGQQSQKHTASVLVLHGSGIGKSPVGVPTTGVPWDSGMTATCCPARLPGAGMTAVVIPRDRE